MSDHNTMKEPNLWLPEKDPVTICILGKLAEELNECAGRVARALIQGIDGIEPEDGRTNREHLVDELADVQALLDLANLNLFPDKAHYQMERSRKKYEHKRKWINMVERHGVEEAMQNGTLADC